MGLALGDTPRLPLWVWIYCIVWWVIQVRSALSLSLSLWWVLHDDINAVSCTTLLSTLLSAQIAEW